MAAKQRPSANETRRRILATAQQIFLEKGFDGSLIKNIAAMAQVNINPILNNMSEINLHRPIFKGSLLAIGVAILVSYFVNINNNIRNK